MVRASAATIATAELSQAPASDYPRGIVASLRRWARENAEWGDGEAGLDAPEWATRRIRVPVPDARPRDLIERRQKRRRLPDGEAAARWVTPAEWITGAAGRLASCSRPYVVRDAVCGGVSIFRQRCGLPAVCPSCARRGAVELRERLAAAVPYLGPSPDEPTIVPQLSLITLTIRSRDPGELKPMLRDLHRWYARLVRRTLWRGGRCRARADCKLPRDPDRPGWRQRHPKFTGWLRALEITVNKNGWHAHLHILAEAPYLDQRELSAAWRSITDGAGYIVDIRRVTELRGGVREAVKYVTKPETIVPQRRYLAAELLLALRGIRRWSAGGRFRIALRDFGELEAAADTAAGHVYGKLVLLWSPDRRFAVRLPERCPLHPGNASWAWAPPGQPP